MEVLDNTAPPFAVDIDDDAPGVRVSGLRADRDASRSGHDIEERTLDADAGRNAERVAPGLLLIWFAE